MMNIIYKGKTAHDYIIENSVKLTKRYTAQSGIPYLSLFDDTVALFLTSDDEDLLLEVLR